MNKLKKSSVVLIFLLNLMVIAGFWWNGSGELFSGKAPDIFLALGRIFGLLAVYFVLLQFILMGRTLWVERLFGLDKLARIHKLNGYISISFIIFHPIFLILAYSMMGKIGFLEQYFDFMQNYEGAMPASIATMLFVIIVFLSITMVRKKLKYELWYYIHLLTYLAVLLAFAHQFKLGGDLLGSKYFSYYWFALYAFVFANLLIFRFITPWYKTLKYGFRVDEVVQETNDTTSVYITGKNLERWHAKAGQFIIVRFLSKGFWKEAHPFSLSFIPKNNRIRITIKNSGDFTSKIPEIKKGTKMYIDGPYGVFTSHANLKAKYAFIAGGVGITPIRSLVEKLAPTNDIIVLYSNKNLHDTIFKKELDELAEKHRFPLHYIITDQPDYTGEKGRIDQEKIQRLIKDIQDREVYICGPIPMLDATRKLLMSKEIGVKAEKIHYEKFAL